MERPKQGNASFHTATSLMYLGSVACILSVDRTLYPLENGGMPVLLHCNAQSEVRTSTVATGGDVFGGIARAVQ